MSLMLAVLAVLVVGLAGALAWTVSRLAKRVDALSLQLIDGSPIAPAGRLGPVIEIRILNPFELAVRDTPLAGPASRVVPKMIERIVYSRAAQQIADQLKEQGVDAQVTTHGG